jgi:hypothetical protein
MPVDTELVAAIQDTINSAFDYKMDNIHTAIPCIVIAVRDDGNGQMVDIQPTINQKLPDGTVKERPPILGVPISFPISANGGMTYPITVGTTGMAQFSMRDMEAWKAGNGRPSTPQTQGKMSASDAVFQPGIQPPGSAINNPGKHVLTHSTADVVMFGNLGGAEAEVRIKADGSIEINTSNHPVTINCSVANINANEEVNITTPVMNIDADNTTWIGNISLQGSIVQIGDWTQTGNYTAVGIQSFNGIIFSTHKHIGVTAGTATSGTPVP